MSTISRYRAEPTAAKFHANRSHRVKGLFGPVGTGKTVATTLMEPIYNAMEQTPYMHTVMVPIGNKKFRYRGNIRHIRVMIVRKTYDRIQRSVVKTLTDWTEPEFFEVRDGKTFTGAFFTETPKDPEADAVFIEYEFVAMDRADVFDKLRSFEPTLVVLSEVAEMAKGIIEECVKRLGRFPRFDADNPANRPGPTRAQVVFDLNPPTKSHWFHHRFEGGNCPKSWRNYRQPAAFLLDPTSGEYRPNPLAENIRNLKDGYGYWADILDSGDTDGIRRDVMGEYGLAVGGSPVYPRFAPEIHVAQAELPVLPNQPVYIGMDLETRPAATIYQLASDDMALVTGEAWTDGAQILFDEFIQRYLLPLLRSRYPWGQWQAVLDPSGDKMNPLTDDTYVKKLALAGVAAVHAPVKSNVLAYRHALVNNRLMAGTVRYCPKNTPQLIEALSGMYRTEQRKVEGAMVEKPIKDKWADLADSNQYAFMRQGPIDVMDTSPMRPPPMPLPPRSRHI